MRLSNVGMSNVPCQIYLSNDQLTQLPSWSMRQWVIGSFDKYI